jgi:hypothetical protein
MLMYDQKNRNEIDKSIGGIGRFPPDTDTDTDTAKKGRYHRYRYRYIGTSLNEYTMGTVIFLFSTGLREGFVMK